MIRAGIDWGSSSFRAYRFDEGANVVETVEAASGIKFVENGEFEHALFDPLGHWFTPGDTVLLSGMITSRNGWMESPYVQCPASPAEALEHTATLTVRGINLVFLPGLCQSSPPDVMRGEELQILGADAIAPISLAVMPGTHSKWAKVDAGTVAAFHTIATGELFEVLVKHTLIGAFAEKASWNDGAFADGVAQGFNTTRIITDLFSSRAGALLGDIVPANVYAYLSGLLIGNEIREGIQLNPSNGSGQGATITLVGEPTLCQRYLTALNQLNIAARIGPVDASAEGFSRLICLANNLNQASSK